MVPDLVSDPQYVTGLSVRPPICGTDHDTLNQPRASGTEEGVWDPHHLPMHLQECYNMMLEDITSQMTKTTHNDLCQHYGISHVSEICQIPSIKLFSSFPHEWMHLVLENHVKNLIHLWKGIQGT